MLSFKTVGVAALAVISTILGALRETLAIEDWCTVVKPLDNFDAKRFEGDWFEISRSVNTQVKAACGTINYKLEPDSNQMKFLQKHKFKLITLKISGHLTLNSDGSGNLQGEFSIGLLNGGVHFVIMDTDYTHYAIVYLCSTSNAMKIENIWVLSKEQTLDKSFDDTIVKIVEANKLKLNTLGKCKI